MRFTIDIREFEDLANNFANKLGQLGWDGGSDVGQKWKMFLWVLADEMKQWYVDHIPPQAKQRGKDVLTTILSRNALGFELVTEDEDLYYFDTGWKSFDMRYSFLFRASKKSSVVKQGHTVNVSMQKDKREGRAKDSWKIVASAKKKMVERFKVVASQKGSFKYGGQVKTISMSGKGGGKEWQHENPGWHIFSKLNDSEFKAIVDRTWYRVFGKYKS